MRLDHWLARHKETRSAFARRAGLSPAAVTALCNDPEVWISRETARRISLATGEAVTPNDFLGLSPRDAVVQEMSMSQTRVAEAIRAFEQGEIVVVTDDADRENEGDLILAAEHATTEKLAFFIRHTSGIVCAPITRDLAHRLRLDPMVAANDAPLATAFTVSIDHRHGMTTGISAEERCNTIRALTNPNVGAVDFVRPGHVFPLIARDGGVLIRSGHTEAAIDLCRLAGLSPVGVLSELVNDDGTVKRGTQVADFAAAHGLKIVSVAELIAYRQRNDRLVERIAELSIETPAGRARAVTYATAFDPMHHLAVVWGDIRDGRDVPVRLHLESVVDDVFGKTRGLDRLMARMGAQGRGIIVYLREGSVGVTRAADRRPAPVAAPVDPESLARAELEGHGSAAARVEDWREIGLGAQILRDLGVTSIRLFSSRPRRYVGLEGFGIEIASTEPVSD
ncbi:3,4-dihydroxy-2-butanone-4-phosphate synthase [Siculibacillus lacustris]|uniref:3,4-dihydroxy-2-butanone 4-phosphate synthase n=1 Tax=Siculibacillus lacustris TaxID=1549641 RepID=A0A4Q9VFN7_9HYPH|nr:3,4-dihydroxy-2-butanone-4-phosphate synthase [Siculibacillus lacustris]TBW33564.1 3,4-dihydroxy-2-butanone-4-phosphate synthase [Siculibacillus lacustris]